MQITEIERELSQQKLTSAEDEEQLRARITSLAAQVNDLEMGRKLAEEEAKSKLVSFSKFSCLTVCCSRVSCSFTFVLLFAVPVFSLVRATVRI